MFEKIVSIAVFAMLAFGATACSEEPTCEKVAGHVLKIVSDQMDKELEKLPEEMREQAKAAMAENLTETKFVEECKKANPGKEELACVQKATTMDELSKCGALSGAPAEPAAEEPAAADEAAEDEAAEDEAAEDEAAEDEAAEDEAAEDEAAEDEAAEDEAE